MSLGNKIVALFLVLGISFSLGSFMLLKLTVLPAFQDFEAASTEAALLRVEKALAADLYNLKATNLGYSRNDQTYEFALGRRSQFARNDFDPEYLRSIGIDLLAMFDQDGKRLYGMLSDTSASANSDLDKETFEPLVMGHPLVTRSSVNDSLAGIFVSRRGVMHVTSYPILNSSGSGPVAGSLIVGRLLTAERLKEIEQLTMATVTMHSSFDTPHTSDHSSASIGRVQIRESDAPVSGFYLMHDIYGKSVARIDVSTSRHISTAGTEVMRTVTLLMVGLIVVFLFVSSLLMRQMIIEPLRTLTDKILDIRKSGKLYFEVEKGRTDEVGILAGEFAAMTTELSAGKQCLEQARDDALATSSAKSDFIARMSHEIRTPMSGVLGMTEILRTTSLSTKQRKYTNTIYDSAQSLLGVINNILDFSKIEAGKLNLNFVDVDLNALVEEVVQTHAGHAHSQNTELMIVLPKESHALVKTDPTRLKQVLNNLISNAIKFTKEGEVVVRLTLQPPENGEQRVYFEISDSGIGIELDQQEEIFESFTQAEESTTRVYGGSGLGLTICKQLIGQMGGELVVNSKPQNGSTFSFSLDLETGCDIVSQAAQQMDVMGGKNVLVVDDNEANRIILEHTLGDWRAAARTAGSADEAYGKLVTAMSDGDPYDLVMIDLDMPGKNGFELIRNIRANPRFELLKIIVLSSFALPAREEMFTQLGVAGEISKPVLQSKLYFSLAAVMRHQILERPTAYNNQVTPLGKLTGRVLVVEDNEVNRQVALSMLNSIGLNVELAVNGLEAITKLAAGSYDLVLMDCQLPVMNGWKATEIIRLQENESGKPRTPIIAATANALKSDRDHCLQAGMDDCLIKPFSHEQLHGVLSAYLAKASLQVECLGGHLKSVEDVRTNETRAQKTAIDESILNRLSQLQQPGAPNIVRKLLSLYLQSSVVIKDRLGNAIESSDGVVVRESAHALKSSSLNVGATGLAELCKRLENVGRTGSFKDRVSLRRSLEVEYGRVVNAVESELGETKS